MAQVTSRSSHDNETKIMPSANGQSRQTDIMNPRGNNITAVMNAGKGYVPAGLAVGSEIDGYRIADVISENTGEATLLLAEKGQDRFVLKVYHKDKAPKSDLLLKLNSINSDYIIKRVGSGTYGDRQYSILPYFSKGDLLRNMPIDQDMIVSVIIPSVNEALRMLHKNGIIHRDIKPSNIFLSDDGQKAIIGDFGISSVLKSEASVRVTNMSRTIGYAAPESATGFVSKESDYYSFGITLYHILLNQDPFLGMTDSEILYQTINKKIEVPQSIPYRLQTLIHGLTVKERTDRWGYDEVSRWLKNEDVEVRESTTKQKGIKPYQFNRQYYYSLESLSMAFAENWDNAIKHLYRGFVEKNIIQYGEDYASQAIDLKGLKDQDVAMFRLIRLLNPSAPLCWKGRVFYDLGMLGEAMRTKAPAYDDDILQLLKSGCLVQYLTESQFPRDLIAYVTKCIDFIKDDGDVFYFALMFSFCERTGYSYSGFEFYSLEEFVAYLESVGSAIEIESRLSAIDKDDLFLMWLYSLGYEKQVLKFGWDE